MDVQLNVRTLSRSYPVAVRTPLPFVPGRSPYPAPVRKPGIPGAPFKPWTLDVPTSIHNPPVPLPDASLPTIAIGILSYNRCAEVMTTLDIFLRIDYPREKLRLVVIDNASADGTVETVRAAYGDGVEVLALAENVGAVARNRVMMDRAETYIFTFDEDCAPEHPWMIRRAVEFMEANPYFGALCFRSINLYSQSTEFGDMGIFSRRRLRSGGYEGMFVIGAGMCFRRDAIQRTRGYDESMFWGGEEYALGLELLYNDIAVALMPELTLIHRHAPRAIPPARALEVDTRNNIWSAFKFFPLPLAALVATLHTGRRLLTALIKQKPGGREAVLRGAREGLAGIRGILPYSTPIPVSLIARHNRWFFQMFYALRPRKGG
jgi:GT2 family glycosyltransferase